MHQLDALSLWKMFAESGACVKYIIALLGGGIVLTWTIVLVKAVELSLLRQRLRLDLKCFAVSKTLFQSVEMLTKKRSIVSVLSHAVLDEWKHSEDFLADQDGLKERVALCLERIEEAASRHIITGMGVLAIIGSAAPFVGLLGTVWGIMTSFIGISRLHSSNLAVVAPGIAEALLATTCGLIAAIPASVFYNIFSRQINAYRGEMADAATLILRTVSRDLSREAHAGREAVKLNFRLAAE